MIPTGVVILEVGRGLYRLKELGTPTGTRWFVLFMPANVRITAGAARFAFSLPFGRAHEPADVPSVSRIRALLPGVGPRILCRIASQP